jgi:hypothetical protein
MPENESSPEVCSTSTQPEAARSHSRPWIRMGVLAAASALAGGLAAAWYYRNTLNRLREAELEDSGPKSEIPDSDTGYEN